MRKEQEYKELKKEFDRQLLMMDAYRHRLKKDLIPGSDEWLHDFEELEKIEELHEDVKLRYGLAKLEYMRARRGFE